MVAKISVAVVTMFLIVSAAPASASGGEGESAAYVGFGSVDHGLNGVWQPLCHALIPQECTPVQEEGLVAWDCAVPQPEVQWGGVLFCDVPRGSKVFLQIEDAVMEEPLGTVVCLADVPGDGNGYRTLTQIRGQGTVELPTWCKPTPGAGASGTELGVIIEGPPDEFATHGRVHRAFV